MQKCISQILDTLEYLSVIFMVVTVLSISLTGLTASLKIICLILIFITDLLPYSLHQHNL